MTRRHRITLGTGAAILALSVLGPAAAAALTLNFPVPARQTAMDVTPEGAVALPVAAYAGGTVETETGEGRVTLRAWQLPGRSLTTAQLLAPLRDQLLRDGYEIRFDCTDRTCGGFDFRYSVDLLQEPDMHVDLGDYRYLVAANPDVDGTELVSLMVSRSASAGYVQLTRVSTENAPQSVVTSTKSQINLAAAPVQGGLLAALGAEGRAPRFGRAHV